MEGLLSTGPTPSSLVKTTNLTPRHQCDVFRAAFCNLAMFFYRMASLTMLHCIVKLMLYLVFPPGVATSS